MAALEIRLSTDSLVSTEGVTDAYAVNLDPFVFCCLIVCFHFYYVT